MLKFLKPLVFVCFMYACNVPSEGKDAQIDTLTKSSFHKEVITVKVVPVREGGVNQEIISNGKVFAWNNAEIRFPIAEKIKAIYVKNGDRVVKGQILALLDDAELKSKLQRTRSAIEKASVELDDRLIDYGYRLKDSLKVPLGILKMAKTKSGYNAAMYDYSDSRTALGRTKIIAPFSGKIADVEAREYNNSETFRKLCTLIDDSRLLVEFNVLESEFHILSKGAKIDVIPYGGDLVVKGLVGQINPMIDANGMIKIIATVENTGNNLLNGMSVRIVVKKMIPNKMFIPKEAVLKRQNHDIVFTYEDGHAKWNYVETGLQNSAYITIRSGLKKGQMVIVSNNANLADDVEVSLDSSLVSNE